MKIDSCVIGVLQEYLKKEGSDFTEAIKEFYQVMKQIKLPPLIYVDISSLDTDSVIQNWDKEHKHMLAHAKEMLEYQNGQVAINPRHNKLITSLRTALENGEGSLDKEATNHDDNKNIIRTCSYQ